MVSKVQVRAGLASLCSKDPPRPAETVASLPLEGAPAQEIHTCAHRRAELPRAQGPHVLCRLRGLCPEELCWGGRILLGRVKQRVACPTGEVATAGSSRTLPRCVQSCLPWFLTCHLGLSRELPHRPLCRRNEPMVVELLEGWALGTCQQLLLGACSRRGPAVGTRVLTPLGPHSCPTGGGSYVETGG